MLWTDCPPRTRDSAVNSDSPCYHRAYILVESWWDRQSCPVLRCVLLKILKEAGLCSQAMFIIGAALLH